MPFKIDSGLANKAITGRIPLVKESGVQCFAQARSKEAHLEGKVGLPAKSVFA